MYFVEIRGICREFPHCDPRTRRSNELRLSRRVPEKVFCGCWGVVRFFQGPWPSPSRRGLSDDVRRPRGRNSRAQVLNTGPWCPAAFGLDFEKMAGSFTAQAFGAARFDPPTPGHAGDAPTSIGLHQQTIHGGGHPAARGRGQSLSG